MAMDVPAAWATTAVQDMTELRQIKQKAILSLETAHLSLEAAQQLESDSVTVLKDAKHLLAGITVVLDRAVKAQTDRKSVVEGKRVTVRRDVGGRGFIKKKKK